MLYFFMMYSKLLAVVNNLVDDNLVVKGINRSLQARDVLL